MGRSRAEGWALVALDVDVDTTTPSGRLVANVMASVAEWERETIGARTRDSLAAKRAQGVVLGRPRSVRSEAVERARELRDTGLSFRELSAHHCGRRVPIVSAMTLLGRSDGDVSDYTDDCDAISDEGAATTIDLEALWRRVAFSVAIHNTDDHLRIHGFTRAPGGWTLAPPFEINPNPDVGTDRVTGIDGARAINGETLGLDSLAAECRLDASRRSQIVIEILHSVAGWETVDASMGLRNRRSHASRTPSPPRRRC